MEQASADDLWAKQAFQFEFEPDGKQQQQHAEMGDVLKNLAILQRQINKITYSAEEKSGGQISHQRWQADGPYKHSQGEGKGKPDGFNHIQSSCRLSDYRVVYMSECSSFYLVQQSIHDVIHTDKAK